MLRNKYNSAVSCTWLWQYKATLSGSRPEAIFSASTRCSPTLNSTIELRRQFENPKNAEQGAGAGNTPLQKTEVVERLWSKPLTTSEFLAAFREQYAIQIWAATVQRNEHIITRAHQQILTMLPDAPVTAIEILSGLEYTQKVLLTCAVTVQDSSTPANSLKPRDWTDNEKDKFCSEFTSFVSGLWGGRDILSSWEKLVKVS